jgi:hypothetical protein
LSPPIDASRLRPAHRERRPASPGRAGRRAADALVALVVTAALLAGCGGPEAATGNNAPPVEAGAPAASNDWGVEPLSVRVSAAGYILDFRYQVTDPDRARPLLQKQVIPYVLHPQSGATLMVPAPAKVGPLRQTTLRPEKGRTYFVLFANPGGLVQAGDHVTIVIGDYRAEDLIVE